MNTEPLADSLKLRAVLFLGGVFILIILFANLASSAESGGIAGIAEWQESLETNRMRCGVPGLLANSNYYSVRIDRETIWKMPTNGLKAIQIVENRIVYDAVTNNSCTFDGEACPMVSSNSWVVSIPFPTAADMSATEGGPCDDVFLLENGCECASGSRSKECSDSQPCGNLCRTAFNQLQTSGPGSPEALPIVGLRTNEFVESDSLFILDTTTTFEPGYGTQRTIRETFLRQPTRIHALVEDVLVAAKESDSWYDGKLFLNSIRSDFNLQCVFASLLRYRIKFPSRLGVRYTVKWDLKVIRYQPTAETNLIQDLSWSGWGNGGTRYTSFQYLPDPELWETSDGEVVNVRIEATDHCAGGKCRGDNEWPGDGDDFLNSAGFTISLGAGTVDGTAGVIEFHEEQPSALMATPAALRFDFAPGVVEVRTNADGAIHIAAPTVLARITRQNERAYWIHCSSGRDGVYATNTPFLSHLIVNPDSDGPPRRLQHVRVWHADGRAVTNEFAHASPSPNVSEWRLISGNGLKGERLIKTGLDGGRRIESHRRFDPATGRELTRRDDLYQTGLDREWLLSRTLDPDGLALTTTNRYDARGRLTLAINADGSWERREYHPSSGLLARLIRPFTNQPPDAADAECRVTEYGYEPVPGAPDSPIANPWMPRVVRESIRGAVIRATLFAHLNESSVITRVAARPEAPEWNHPDNEESRVQYDARHRVVFERNPDGTSVVTSYQPDADGQTTLRTSLDAASVEFRREEERRDRLGRPVFRRTTESGVVVEEELHSHPDEFGRPTRITHLDGTTTVPVRPECCSVRRSIDRDGTVTAHEFDRVRRLTAITRNGVTESNLYDAADRLVATIRHAASGNPIPLRGLEYDAADRVIRESNGLRQVTRRTYSRSAQGGSVTTQVNPDGGVRVEIRHRDGSLDAVTGSAAFPVRFVHGVGFDDGSPRETTTEIRLDRDGNDTAEWIQVCRDQAGRSYKTNYSGADAPFSRLYFNGAGQLRKQRDPDGVVTLFEYNARGEREFTCIDANRSGSMEFDGPDRITRVTTDFAEARGIPVRRTRTLAWITENASVPTVLQTIEESLDGFRRWQTDGNVTRHHERTRPVNGAYSIREIAPGGAYSVQYFNEGRLSALARFDSNGVSLARTTFTYDGHGRRIAATESRAGTTRYQFDDADRIVRITSPAPGVPGGRPQTTVTQHDSMGRATNVIRPDGSRISRTYSHRGELLLTSGGDAHPAAHAYDAQGRRTHTTNWSHFASRLGARVRSWDYDPHRGWLSRERCADGTGPAFEYTPAGRLLRRTAARGIVTGYTYNDSGAVTRIDYNDETTPAVTFGYDRLGRTIQVLRGADAWRLAYDTAGRLVSEFRVAGNDEDAWGTAPAWIGVTNRFDPAGKRIQLSAMLNHSPLTVHRYRYDPAGRLDSAADSTGTALFSYDGGASVPQRVQFQENGVTRLTTVRSLDLMNRLTSISSRDSTAAPAFGLEFEYTYDELNRPARVTLGDGSFWINESDARGQITSSRRHWADGTPVAGQQFEAAFDDSGNRLASRRGGDENGAHLRETAAEANTLHQLIRRDVPPFLDIVGAAAAPASVTVNQAAANRHGEYYRTELTFDPTAGALWLPIVCQAAQDGATNTVAGHRFIPRMPETFTYDADGNLTSDGRWSYFWDAENRLTTMVAHDSVPAGARLALQFDYDFRGRRIRKTVDRWTNDGWSRTRDERYVHDGGNLLAVLNATNRAVIQTLLWSANDQDAVEGTRADGALLILRDAGADGRFAGQFVMHDGRGNVAGLMDAQTGGLSACYEYGPHGELIRSTGPASGSNPMRFLTQYHDDETGLIYDGQRYSSSVLGISFPPARRDH